MIAIYPEDHAKSIEPERPPRLVAVLAYEGVSAFELGIAVEVFGLTGMGPDWYRVLVCSDRPGEKLSVRGGLQIVADAGLEPLHRAGTVIVPGSPDIDAPPSPAIVDVLRRVHTDGKRIASICSGVFVLAAAGLLEGRRAAVHWANAKALARRHPQITVDPDVLYVDEGDILTSAGVPPDWISACTSCGAIMASRSPTRPPAASWLRRIAAAAKRNSSRGRCRARATGSATCSPGRAGTSTRI
jgi:putative intracellular protease/amidase